ncbi:PEBP-like protein [Artomyces pyxidatus]|uniref:PEBP-like protein n=1 Tax=Artomyces pyxidatus TaxID=48021 RepID=A0ACB8SHL6_9AGAM|nr:PEBP-like protein [Artomyces pyxidatus]
MFWSFSLVLLLATPALLSPVGDTSLKVVREEFNEFHIPGNLSMTFNPTALLEVTFPEKNAPPVRLHAGIHLPISDVAGPPSFGLLKTLTTPIPGHGPFVVAAVDLDAAPQYGQIRHFLGGDYTPGPVGLDGVAKLTNSTPAVSEFIQPAPPVGDPPHRYVFLLFKQPAGFDSQTAVNATTPVTNFNIASFSQTVGLGEPIGGTFMLVAAAST